MKDFCLLLFCTRLERHLLQTSWKAFHREPSRTYLYMFEVSRWKPSKGSDIGLFNMFSRSIQYLCQNNMLFSLVEFLDIIFINDWSISSETCLITNIFLIFDIFIMSSRTLSSKKFVTSLFRMSLYFHIHHQLTLANCNFVHSVHSSRKYWRAIE